MIRSDLHQREMGEEENPLPALSPPHPKPNGFPSQPPSQFPRRDDRFALRGPPRTAERVAPNAAKEKRRTPRGRPKSLVAPSASVYETAFGPQRRLGQTTGEHVGNLTNDGNIFRIGMMATSVMGFDVHNRARHRIALEQVIPPGIETAARKHVARQRTARCCGRFTRRRLSPMDAGCCWSPSRTSRSTRRGKQAPCRPARARKSVQAPKARPGRAGDHCQRRAFPLMGLVGTICRMVELFSSLGVSGLSDNAAVLAKGISVILRFAR